MSGDGATLERVAGLRCRQIRWDLVAVGGQGKGWVMALQVIITVSESLTSDAGRAESVRLLRQVGDRIGDGADKGAIAAGNPVKAKAEWKTVQQ